MKFFDFFFLIVLWGFLTFDGNARALQMEKLSTQDGLFSSRFFKTYRDQQGYLWVAGINGVSRYDGSHFVNFTEHSDTSNYFIRGTRFYEIIQDKEGCIWIGGDSGLHKYDIERNTFKQIAKNRIRNVTFLHLSNDSTLEVSCGNKKNFYVHVKKDKIRELNERSETTSVVFDDMGIEWRSNSSGLIIYNHKDTIVGLNSRINDLCFSSHGNLCIATQNGLYILLQKEIKKGKKNLLHITEQGTKFSLTNNAVVSLEFADGCLWAATRRGLNQIWFNNKGQPKQIKQFYNKPDEAFSLLNNQVNDIYIDCENIIWISTHGGLNKIDPLHFWFKSYRHDPGKKNSLHDNNIFPIEGDKSGNIWFGSYERGLSGLNTKNQKFNWINKSVGVNIKSVRYIYNNQDRTWVVADGTLYFTEKDKLSPAIILTEKGRKFNPDNMTSIICHSNGDYWLGMGNSLVRAQKTHRDEFQIQERFAIKSFVVRFYEDTYKRIWAGTNGGGLVLFDYNNPDTISTFNDHSHPVLKSNTFQAVNQDSEGNLWLGTIKGLYTIKNDSVFKDSPAKVNFKAFFEENGLSHNYVTGILPADNGVLWLSSWRGIMKYDPNNIRLCRFTPFSFSDGLIDEKYNRLGAFLDKKTGTYYFGCVNGVNYFSPEKKAITKILPRVLVGKILLNGDLIKMIPEPERSGSIIANIKKRGVLDQLQVRFGSSSLILPEKQVFAWKLVGRDKNWTYSRERELTIFDIEPGNYTLKIRAATKEGKLGAPVYIKISILSYSRTLVYLGIALLLITAVIFWFVRKKDKNLEQKKKDNKYVYSKLTTDRSEGIAGRLEELMIKDKPYLDQNLTADKLAGMLGISQGELSQLLNDYLKTKFYEYINKYRIEEFVCMLQTPESEKVTLTALAEQCGFTSKSTFYRAFNNEKGMTPAQFAKTLKQK